MTLGLLLCAMTSSQMVVLGSLFTIKSLGYALLFAPIMLSVRRYTTTACRSYGFATIYTVWNSVQFIAALLVNAARNLHHVTAVPENLSIWRMVVWSSAFFAACSVIV